MALEFHEPREQLPLEVIEQHRAVASLIEELEAVIWYQQRASVSKNEALTAALRHNRNEELEHACIMLEWLRRNLPGLDENMQTYLFSNLPIADLLEKNEEDTPDAHKTPDTERPGESLRIGSMKG